MPNVIEKLYDLQQIDLQRLRIIKDVKQALEDTKEPRELADLRSRVQTLGGEQDALRSNQRIAESQVETVKEKIAANQAMLHSGQLTDPKAIASLQTSIDELENNKASLEERALAALLEYEDKHRTFQPLQTRLQKQEAQWQAVKEEFQQRQTVMAQEMKGLNEQRKAHAKHIDTTALQVYEDLLKRKNGIAVTTISNSSCDACFMSLPTSVATAPRNHTASAGFLLCPSCGRILVQR